jgi:2-polyprenyl-3-methyl-5-hydroxy-6-metoxy-1,4-benzoquinol methylase
MSQTDYQIRFPTEEVDFTRQQEYFFVIQNGIETQYIVHHYHEVYSVPLLYERMAIMMNYQSPQTILMQLILELTKCQIDIQSLVVFDIAAGSGLMGKQLASVGIKSVVGLDILPEAAEAATRDYPGVYEKYYVEDLTNLTPAVKQELEERGFNCLICCSSISCHFPVQAFINAFNLMPDHGWIAFNVSTYILEEPDQQNIFESVAAVDFSQLYHKIVKADILEISQKHYYLHRFMTNGKPVYYVSVIARKRGNIPDNY